MSIKNWKSWKKSTFLIWLRCYENGKYKKFCENFEKNLPGEEIDIQALAVPFILKTLLKFQKKEENDKMMEILTNLITGTVTIDHDYETFSDDDEEFECILSDRKTGNRSKAIAKQLKDRSLPAHIIKVIIDMALDGRF